MEILILLAPIFLIFELGQLVICERYVGIKQIERRGDPRAVGPSEWVSFLWTAILTTYWLWMALLLFERTNRVHGLFLLLISIAGYLIRRACALKWVLVVLTFEGAVRVGLLFSLCAYAWRRL